MGALAYCVQDAVFTGDTLFGAGCGRLFEGTPQLMQTSLMTLAALPGSTKVYFGHEYTRANLAFARAVEPNNSALRARIERAAQGRTTPSTIAEECTTNPFLRCNEASIRQALGPQFSDSEGHEVFAELRRRKDGFRA
jgi:hydroxyacylglutathione hydrolase